MVRRLRGYKYYKDDKEIAQNVRKWANRCVQLLDSAEELQKERDNASKTKDKMMGYSNDSPRIYDADPPNYNSEAPEMRKAPASNEESPSPEPMAEEEEPKKTSGKKGGKKGGKKKPKDPEESPAADDDGEQEPNEDFDPDAFADKPAKGKKKKGSKDKGKEPAGEFKFDENADMDDFHFDDDDNKAEAEKKPPPAKKGNDDDWMAAVAPQQPVKKQPVPDPTDALFDFTPAPAKQQPKQPVVEALPAPKQGPSSNDFMWDQISGLEATNDPKGAQAKKPAQPQGKSLNDIQSTQVMSDNFMNIAPAAPAQPVYNPYMQPQPMYNPYAQPYAAAQPAMYMAAQPAPAAAPPAAAARPAANPAAKDPFSDFSW